MLAAALTVVVPSVYLAIDHVIGLPNAARWLGNGLILLAAYSLDRFYTAMTGGSPHARRRHQRLLAYLVLTLGLMALTLGLARLHRSMVSSDIRPISAPLVAYRLLYVAFFALVLERMIRNCTRYLRASQDQMIKLAMVCDIVGAAWAVVYLMTTLLVALLPAGSAAAAPLVTTIQLSILFAVVCLLAGSTLPLWGRRVGVPALLRQVRMLLAYWRLTALWRVLVAEVPTVILPLPVLWRSALFVPESLDVLLYRRVIEILDAWRQVDGIREMHEAMAAASAKASRSGVPQRMHSSDEPAYGGRDAGATDSQTTVEALDSYARIDAHHLVETLQYVRRHPDPPEIDRPVVRGMVTAYQPTTYVDQMHYLERVARYVRAERHRQAV